MTNIPCTYTYPEYAYSFLAVVFRGDHEALCTLFFLFLFTSLAPLPTPHPCLNRQVTVLPNLDNQRTGTIWMKPSLNIDVSQVHLANCSPAMMVTSMPNLCIFLVLASQTGFTIWLRRHAAQQCHAFDADNPLTSAPFWNVNLGPSAPVPAFRQQV
jgi:hypothetical protein